MQHDEFIGRVQARARLSDRGTAEAATRATLETLAERISGPLAGNLAAQLPREIGAPLRQVDRHGDAHERLDRARFVSRVSERAPSSPSTATYRARVVLEMVDEATTRGPVNNLREGLPDDLHRLVDFWGGAGSSGGSAGPGGE